MLGALLSVGGKGLREELSKQMKLVQLLGGVAEKVRQASGSTRQVCTHEKEHKYCFVFETNLYNWTSPVSSCIDLISAGIADACHHTWAVGILIRTILNL